LSKNLKITLFISILFIAIIRLKPIWERNPGGGYNFIYYLAIVILFFWIISKIIQQLIRIIKKRKELNFLIFLPLIILVTVFLDATYNPLKINLNIIYSKLIFQACYEGTQNQATFKLRENNDFDIHWTGAFFADNFYTGTYRKKNDTLFMDFNTEIPNFLDDTLIIEKFYLVKPFADSVTTTHFYLGKCQGYN
jgi:hypothetical protein